MTHPSCWFSYVRQLCHIIRRIAFLFRLSTRRGRAPDGKRIWREPVPGSRQSLPEVFARINARFANMCPRRERQIIEAASTRLIIDLAKGEHAVIMPRVNITDVIITNWLPAPLVNDIIIEVNGSGGFNVDLSFASWPDGKTPANTRGIDRFQITSHDGGKTKLGLVCGQNYPVPEMPNLRLASLITGTPELTVSAA